MAPAYEVARATHPGAERDLNEDQVWVEREQGLIERSGLLLAVADGMGGHQAGEVASQIAIDALRQAYYGSLGGTPRDKLRQAMQAANQQVALHGRRTPGQRGMGTTLTAAVWRDGMATIASVGDSRAYVIQGRAARQLTRDDSLVAEQVRMGTLTPEEAREHPRRNVLTRALGRDETLHVQPSEHRLRPGAHLLLCTDGLYTMVEDHELASLVQAHPAAEALERLVQLANQRGGPDNISAVLLKTQGRWPLVALPPRWRLPLAAGGAIVVLLGGGILLGGRWHSQSSAAPTAPLLATTPTAAPATPTPAPTPTLPPTPTAAPTPAPASALAFTLMRVRDDPEVRAARGLAVRAAPTAAAGEVRRLQPGERVELVKEFPLAGVSWAVVALSDGTVGFARATFLEPAEGAPAPSSTPATPTPAPPSAATAPPPRRPPAPTPARR